MFHFIYNTKGEYVAYIYDERYCFSKDNEYIGRMVGRDLYSYDGLYLGSLTYDDRIIKQKGMKKGKISSVVRPATPVQPLRPLKRLRMPSVGWGYEDVFLNNRTTKGVHGDDTYNHIIGSKIYSTRGKYLGNLDFNRYNHDSVSNQYGPYGSVYSNDSIFNQYGPYGSKYSIESPFNQYSQEPILVKDDNNRIIAYLSDNAYLNHSNLINATAFFNWFRRRAGL